MDMNLFWLILTLFIPAFLLAFAYGETYALVKHKQTYTRWIRAKLGIQPVAPRHVWAAPVFAAVLGLFSLWFELHIEAGIW